MTLACWLLSDYQFLRPKICVIVGVLLLCRVLCRVRNLYFLCTNTSISLHWDCNSRPKFSLMTIYLYDLEQWAGHDLELVYLVKLVSQNCTFKASQSKKKYRNSQIANWCSRVPFIVILYNIYLVSFVHVFVCLLRVIICLRLLLSNCSLCTCD